MTDSENGKRAGKRMIHEPTNKGTSVFEDLDLTCKRCPDRKRCVFVDDPINFEGYCIANMTD
jgi:hypothetical protein